MVTMGQDSHGASLLPIFNDTGVCVGGGSHNGDRKDGENPFYWYSVVHN